MPQENQMISLLRPAVIVFALLTLITGIAYPLGMIALARVLPAPTPQSLVGQSFSEPQYFWGRLSATAPAPYTAFDAKGLTGSSGSNLAPSNPQLLIAARGRIDALAEASRRAGLDATPAARIPVDLVTASGSGLDPHLSIAGAEVQVARVAKARGVAETTVRELVRRATITRQFGVLGEPVVDIPALNRALDHEAPLRRP